MSRSERNPFSSLFPATPRGRFGRHTDDRREGKRPEAPAPAPRGSTLSQGWFPDCGGRPLGPIWRTFPGLASQWPSRRTSHPHRCGGSAGITPASQFSASPRHPENVSLTLVTPESPACLRPIGVFTRPDFPLACGFATRQATDFRKNGTPPHADGKDIRRRRSRTAPLQRLGRTRAPSRLGPAQRPATRTRSPSAS